MDNLEEIAETIHAAFASRTAAREEALSQARALTRHCANAIRAIHREERATALEEMEKASVLVKSLRQNLALFPEIYFEGYTQDALKEYAEAVIVYSLTGEGHLPTPEQLELEYATYLKGMAEAIGELRRRCLDSLRLANTQEAERMLTYMDDIFAVLVTMDYPEAITGGLRRLTDIARSLIERTRGDLTLSLRHEKLEGSLRLLEEKLNGCLPL
ncbi:MAG: haloacid dehalogenase [Anaerolineales bacterium]|nr:haloacid dehalogenase [Anaerolineales bacterium]MDW8446067.1 haloacid dehalogenase [Anaerolineales bacterium]